MKIAALFCFAIIGSGLVGIASGAMYVYKELNSNNYAEIILENTTNQDIQVASVDYEDYHIVVKNIRSGKQSPRIMYDTSSVTLNTNFVLDVTFADGSTLHLTKLREVGSGEKVTVVIDLHDAHTALRKAGSF